MKTELLKQLEQAELEKIRAIDRVKELKARIKEGENDDEGDDNAPIKTLHTICGYSFWLEPKYLYELIAEQRKLDVMKKAVEDYRKIIEQEDK
jgi:hypothetical protein